MLTTSPTSAAFSPPRRTLTLRSTTALDVPVERTADSGKEFLKTEISGVDTKLPVYKAVVLPTLLYGAESWTTYSRHLRALEQHHQRTLRRILRIKWEDRRTNICVLEEAKMPSITTLIMQHQLRWTGHLVRELQAGKRNGSRTISRPL